MIENRNSNKRLEFLSKAGLDPAKRLHVVNHWDELIAEGLPYEKMQSCKLVGVILYEEFMDVKSPNRDDLYKFSLYSIRCGLDQAIELKRLKYETIDSFDNFYKLKSELECIYGKLLMMQHRFFAAQV